MVVYWEYAFAENFILDGVLLYLALKCAKTKIYKIRLAAAAAVGAAEAIVFPLLSVPAWSAYLIKALGGILLCVIAVHGKKLKPYLITSAAFFFFTFALGGLLTAAYSFFGATRTDGGYLIGQAPVGLVIGGLLLFAVAVVKLSQSYLRYRKVRQNLLACTLTAGGREVKWQGYADSGNCLEFRGKPVCVVSVAAVFALFGRNLKESGRIRINTVNGAKESPVFECEKMKIFTGEQTVEKSGVYLTVGDVGKSCQLILNTALMEA